MKKLAWFATLAFAAACSEPSPPPITGGTLLLAKDGQTAVVADPGRDRVWFADVNRVAILGETALRAGDHPSRVAQDASRRVHVVLRGAGSLATIGIDQREVLSRRQVCPEPRGVAYDARADVLHVACAGGELVTIPAEPKYPVPIRVLHLPVDLRDVVVDGNFLLVSRFRAAEVLVVSDAGTVVRTITIPAVSVLDPSARAVTGQLEPPGIGLVRLEPSVAWRMAPMPGGGAIVVHQRAPLRPLSTQPGGYASGGGCGLVHGAITIVKRDQAPIPGASFGGVLPVDVAASPDGTTVAVATAGGLTSGALLITAPTPPPPPPEEDTPPEVPCVPRGPEVGAGPETTGVAFASAGRRIAFSRRGVLSIEGTRITLSADPQENLGHQVFHQSSTAGVACASCHPEGRDDGRVWDFEGLGLRRTQVLRGQLDGTEPFHWSGDMRNIKDIVEKVLFGRMGGLPGLNLFGGGFGVVPAGAARPSPEGSFGGQGSLGSLPPLSGFGTAPPGASTALAGPVPVAAPVTTTLSKISTKLADWLGTLPALKPSLSIDTSAAARGASIFQDPLVGCTDCHNGARLTNNASKNVGTGGLFQVPSLIGVRFRGPFMHDGCAKTLRDRFGACGGGDKHGTTSHLSERELDDLVAYLKTL